MADDLSGALEIAGAACALGFSGSVALQSAACSEMRERDIAVYCSRARIAPGNEVENRVREGLQSMAQWRSRGLYMKMDSTMRGPMAREMQTVLESAGDGSFLMTPAIPAVGRTVRDGRVYVNGVALDETDFQHDPLFPTRDSFIPMLLRPLKTGRIPLGIVRSSREGLTEALRQCWSENGPVAVCDAETDEDLDRLARASFDAAADVFYAGSAGLFRALARRGWLGEAGKKNAPELPSPGKCLFINGSRHPASRAQIRHLRERAVMPAVGLEPTHAAEETERGDVCRKLSEALRSHGRAILHIKDSAAELSRSDSLELPARLAEIVGSLDREIGLDTLFIAGGDTAQAICEKLEAAQIDGIVEYMPGAVFGRLRGKEKSWTVFIKPGGYGEAELLVKALHWLEKCSHSSSSAKGVRQ